MLQEKAWLWFKWFSLALSLLFNKNIKWHLESQVTLGHRSITGDFVKERKVRFGVHLLIPTMSIDMDVQMNIL